MRNIFKVAVGMTIPSASALASVVALSALLNLSAGFNEARNTTQENIAAPAPVPGEIMPAVTTTAYSAGIQLAQMVKR